MAQQAERLSGKRVASGVNPVKVARVLELLGEHMARYAASPVNPSIGVLSPFRDQVETIRKKVAANLSLENCATFACWLQRRKASRARSAT